LLQEYNDEVIVTERFNEIRNEAMVQAREDHKKRPHDAVPYGYAAYLYMAKGNVDAAQKTVDEGFKLRNGKEVPTLWRVKADIEARQHKYEQALADYDMAIKVFRKPANVQRDLGSQITHLHRQRVLKELGRTDQTSDAPTFSEHR
jgi:tetratricopeptide (TPR) repeat protein